MAQFQLLTVRIVTEMKDEFVVTEVTRSGPDACTPPEVEILKRLFGPNRVTACGHEGFVERDPLTEFLRIEERYCRSQKHRETMQLMFPGRPPRMPLVSDEFPPGSEDPELATVESLKAEFKRRKMRLPPGRPTVERLRLLLSGDPIPEEADALADAG